MNPGQHSAKNHEYRLNPADWITLSYLLVTFVYLLLNIGRLPHPALHSGMRLVMILFIFFITRYGNNGHNILLKLIRDLYPLLFLAFFFYETDAINNLWFDNFDPLIVRIETGIFGTLPSEIFAVRFPQLWISELMNLGYFSFYLIIIFFVFAYYFIFPDLFPLRFYVFLQSFYIFYIIFILFPSAGPQYYFDTQQVNMVHRGVMGHIMQYILETGDRPTGAFPSSHIGMTWLIMIFFFRDKRTWFWVWLIPAVLLSLATVYIRAHYVIDVAAGFIMSGLLYFLGEKTSAFFRRNVSPALS